MNRKTIEVSDEMYNSLVELSKELNSQDHRSTAMPYIFQIRTQEQVSAGEGCGTEAWHYDGSLIETEKEIEDAINELKGWDEATTKINFLSDLEKDEILKEFGYNKINYEYKDKYENAFLTEKACKEHIRLNHYHYYKPVDYLSHAFRNPELEMVLKFLCEITGGKIHT